MSYTLSLTTKPNQCWSFKVPKCEYDAQQFNYLIKTDGSIYKIILPVNINQLVLLTDTIVNQLINGSFQEEDAILLYKINFKIKHDIHYAVLIWKEIDYDDGTNKINWRVGQIVRQYSNYPSSIPCFMGDCVITFHCVK